MIWCDNFHTIIHAGTVKRSPSEGVCPVDVDLWMVPQQRRDETSEARPLLTASYNSSPKLDIRGARTKEGDKKKKKKKKNEKERKKKKEKAQLLSLWGLGVG